MSSINLLLNILWLLFGGFLAAIGWVVAGLVMAITIIGLPWARAAFSIAAYMLFPFGSRAVPRSELDRGPDLGTSLLGTFGNIIWLVLAGWWLALLHVLLGIAYFITLIGIPFGWAHFKLAGLALWPIGKDVVSIEELRRVRDRGGR